MVKLLDLIFQKGKFATKGHVSTNSIIPSIYMTIKSVPKGKTISLKT